MNQCPVCNASNQSGALYCEMCGNRLASAAPAPVAATPAAAASGGNICPVCGHSAVPGELFCEECGTPLNTQAAPAAMPAPAAQPPAQPAPQASYPPPTPIGGAVTNCGACGAAVVPGEAFCDSCGAALMGQPAAQAPANATIPPVPTPTPSPMPVNPAPAAPAPMPAPAASPPPPAAMPTPPPVAAPTPPAISTLHGWALTTSGGQRLALPDKAEAILGREDAASNHFPDIDFDPLGGLNDGVGRKHARLFLQHGTLYIEDLNSTNGTLVNRQRLAPNQPQMVQDGDEVRLGKLVLTLGR